MLNSVSCYVACAAVVGAALVQPAAARESSHRGGYRHHVYRHIAYRHLYRRRVVLAEPAAAPFGAEFAPPAAPWSAPQPRRWARGGFAAETNTSWGFGAPWNESQGRGGGEGSALDGMVAEQAGANGVPVSLVERVIRRESGGNPRAVSRGNYGLMQIRLGTARAMGYGGSASGLLDAATNMTYAVRYLAGAYRAAGGNESRAVALYARGYYHEAKAEGFSPYQDGFAPYQSSAGMGTPFAEQQPFGERPLYRARSHRRHWA